MEFSSSLKNNYEFRRLYSKGDSAVSPVLVLYCRKNRKHQNRLGITVSPKLGNAVFRNRTRRRIREIYRTNEEKFSPGYDIVAVARGRTGGASYSELEKAFLSLSERLGILR